MSKPAGMFTKTLNSRPNHVKSTEKGGITMRKQKLMQSHSRSERFNAQRAQQAASLRKRPVVQTTVGDLIAAAMESGGNSGSVSRLLREGSPLSKRIRQRLVFVSERDADLI